MKNIYKPVIAVVFAAIAYIIFESIEFTSYSSKELFTHQLKLKNKYQNLTYQEILKLPKQDRPDLAALQHFEMTKDPSLGFPPVERKVAAYEKLKAKYKNGNRSKTSADQVQWDERGPNNVGGRTRALMFDPNDATNKKVWAGGISGGLWVNEDITNQNIGWIKIDDFMASLSIATLAYDPNSTNTFYLGTGERYTYDFAALGIWKSTDGGENWTQLSNTSGFSYVPKMVVTNNSTIIAATANGIKRSTDGGDTWDSPATASMDMADVELAANGDLFAGDFSGNVHKSTDDGVTWSSVSPSSGGYRVEVGISPASNDVIYAMSSNHSGSVKWLVKSTDGGDNWSDLPIPKYSNQDCTESSNDFTRGQAWYDLIIGVHPTDENIVIVGGIDLHRSTDGGNTWGMVSYWTGGCDAFVHADQHAIVFRPENPNEAIFGNDGGVFYSSDVGDATDPDFISRNKNYNVTQFYAATTVNEVLSNEFLAGSQDNGTQRFLDAGVNSTTVATGGDGGFCHIDRDDPNFQITSYVYSNYWYSTNHGESFGNLFFDNNSIGRFINPTEYDSDANILYGAAETNEIGRISNITDSPTDLEVINIDLDGSALTTIKASPYTENRLFVGVQSSGGGLIFRIDNADGMMDITNITGKFDATPGSWVSSIDVGSSDDQLLATFSNYGVQSIFETTDAGANWKSKEGDLDDFPVYYGLYNPYDRKQVVIATELGVWSTEDITTATPNWVTTNIGLANVSTRMIKFRQSDGLLLAATYGRGLFTTSSFSTSSFASMSIENKLTYTGTEVDFTNNSTGTVNNLFWNFGDGYTSTDTNPTHKFASPGIYPITLEINNGQSIDHKEIVILPSRPIPYLAANGGNFEDNPDDFFVENLSGTPLERGKSDIAGKEGTTSGDNAWVSGLTENKYVNNSLAYLYTPGYDFSSAGTYTLSFSANYSFEEGWDGFIIEYSINSGKDWSQLNPVVASGWYDKIGEDNPDQGWPAIPLFTDSTSGFEPKTNDVSFLAGNAKVGFRIHFKTDAAKTDVGMALDDFEVDGPSSTPVADFLSSNPQICEGDTVIYNDNSSGTISDYSWDFGVGASPENATGSGPHKVMYAANGQYSTTLTVTGLSGDVVVTKVDYVNVVIGTAINNEVETNITEFTACDNLDGIITVKNANVGVKYQAFNASTNKSVSTYKIGNGNDMDLNIGELEETISTYIKTTNTSGCEALLSTQPIFIAFGPFSKTVTKNFTSAICSGEKAIFTIENSDTGVDYKIINVEDGSEITSASGDGNDLIIESESITEEITLVVKAVHAVSGCSINISGNLYVIVKPLPDVTITQTGSVMEVPAGESTYQWYFENEIITGGEATKNYYNPSKIGDYTCEVSTAFGCTATSDVFATVVVGLDEEMDVYSVYPNPTYGILNVRSKPNSKIHVFDSTGKLIAQVNTKENLSSINLAKFPRGIYTVKIEFEGKQEVRKIVVR